MSFSGTDFRRARAGVVPVAGVARARETGVRAAAGPAQPALSVIVPMYDEADNVSALVGEICAALGPRDDYEVVLVDDGSRDATLQEMRRAREAYGPRIRILRHDRNLGQSAALCTGVRAARAALIATLDGDRQNDPADIPRLCEAFHAHVGQGVRMVIGERRQRRDAWLRRISSRIANRVRSAFLGDGVADTGCGLKVFARASFLALPPFDHMHRFLPALVRSTGGRILELPVAHRPRVAGRSKYGVRNRLWVGIVDLFGVRWLMRRQAAPFAGQEDLQ
jgi:dolichol-phosphate mannosyltransferase